MDRPGGGRALDLLSVVAPMHDEEALVESFHERVCDALAGIPFEIVIVNDASTDRTGEILDRIAATDPRVRVLHLSRNFGHQAALTAGLDHAHGRVVVLMDADLQDPPELLPRLMDQWRAGYRVVYAVREKRKESLGKRAAYGLFYRLLHRLANIDIPLDAGDFCLMDRRVVDHLLALPEKTRFLRGLRS